MELKDLAYFREVADAAGFRRAADHLNVQQSALSRRVRALEDHLGVSLLERHPGGARLTRAGHRFLEDVRVIFSHLEAALRRARAAGEAGEGMLKIGIVASITSGFVNALLSSYRMAHPQIVVDFVQGDARAHMAEIIGRRLDLAIVTGRPEPSGCDTEQLWREPVLAALHEEDPRAAAEALNLADLARDHFVVSREAPGPEIHDYLVQRLATLGFSPSIDEQRVAREGLMALVGLRFGITLVSGAEAAVRYPNVAFVPLADEKLPFSIVWSPENDNPALRRFLSVARIKAKAGGVS